MRTVLWRRAAVWLAFVTLAGCSGAPASSSSASASTGPAGTPSATASVEPSVAIDIEALLDARRSSYGAPGGLALVRARDRSWTATSGAADVNGRAITATTRFRIASITKPIVSTLVLQAVSRGEISLDDVVGDLLPGVVRKTSPITVRMLLNHTSGMFDETNDGDPLADIAKLTDTDLQEEAADLKERYFAGEHVIGSDRLLVALSEAHPRYFEPGDGYHYSNINYQLAAMVLEKVTGHSLSDLLRTGIVEPLGLRHTTIAPPDTASPELRGYGTSKTDGSLVDITDDLIAFGNGGSGGIISTADELLTIMQSIVSGRLIPADLVTTMEMPAKEGYGLGLATYHLSCGNFYGHEGGVNGTASIAMVSGEGDSGVVIALNLRSGGDPRLPALADDMLCPTQ